MNLETILNEWEKDCRIQDDLAEASRSTPSLHAKYLQMLSISKLRLKKLESEQKVLLKEKWLWYNGKMCEEELKEKRREAKLKTQSRMSLAEKVTHTHTRACTLMCFSKMVERGLKWRF